VYINKIYLLKQGFAVSFKLLVKSENFAQLCPSYGTQGIKLHEKGKGPVGSIILGNM
jgi:hypothetical protein